MSPQNGDPITVPNQEIVLGCYYLTKFRKGDIGEDKIFSSPDEVIIAYDNDKVGLHAKIKVRIKGEMIETTVGQSYLQQDCSGRC